MHSSLSSMQTGCLRNREGKHRLLRKRRFWLTGENTLEQSQLKYFALLRYLDATVMEADLNTGTYHLVYLQDQDFVSLRAGVSFEQSLSAFVQAAVHPEDRAEALKPLGGYIRELFE